MLVLPVVLLLARRLTDSNRVAFLLIWIFCMFVLAGYLIWIAYIDDSIQKKMREALETEKQFDDLLSLEPPRRLLEAYERLDAKYGSRIERVGPEEPDAPAEAAQKPSPLPHVSDDKASVIQAEAPAAPCWPTQPPPGATPSSPPT